jgi:hypothetical protein
MPSKKRVAQSRWSTKHAYMESSELGFCGVTGCTDKEQLCSRTEISRVQEPYVLVIPCRGASRFKKNAGLFYRNACWVAQGWNQNVRGNILGFSFTTWNLHFPVYGTKMSEKTLVWQKIHVLKWSSSLLLSSYWILCIQVHAWHVCRTDTIQSERETSLSRPQASMCCFKCSKKNARPHAAHAW